jgi:hypothetical protein
MSSAARLTALVAVAAAAGGGIFAAIDLHGHPRAKPSTSSKARNGPVGPVHGLMLIPLADPDGRVPTADMGK